MKKNLYFYTNLLAWGLVLFLIANYAFAWITPSANPPEANLPAPINVSSDTQTKTGGLNIATGGGNVGIGTTEPGVKLDIHDSTSNKNLQARVYSSGTGGGESTKFILKTSTREWYLQNAKGISDALRIYDQTAGAERLRITTNGNVGIGTTNPGAKLEVSGNIKLSGSSPTYKITNLAAPTASSDAATKGYVDASSGGGCYEVYGSDTCASGWTRVVAGFTTLYIGGKFSSSIFAGGIICSAITHDSNTNENYNFYGISKYSAYKSMSNEVCAICCK